MEMLDRLSIHTETGCYVWLGKISTGGYGYVSYYTTPAKRVCRKAATVAWEIANARERPEGLEIHHTCRERSCVNPEHLRLTNRSENSGDRAPYRFVLTCKHCGVEKQQRDWSHTVWTCPKCNAQHAKEWRERTGYDHNKYRAENRDRINSQRRTRRALAKRSMQP
jgi:hypothetical protein